MAENEEFLDQAMKNQDSTFVNSTKIKFQDSDNDASSYEDEGGIPKEFADVTFGELQRARSDGSQTVYLKSNSEKTGRGRANKNRPVEMSSKKHVKRFREVIQAPKKGFRKLNQKCVCLVATEPLPKQTEEPEMEATKEIFLKDYEQTELIFSFLISAVVEVIRVQRAKRRMRRIHDSELFCLGMQFSPRCGIPVHL